MIVSIDVPTWREFLRTLDGLALHAFLKITAHELRERKVDSWRSVSDAADDVLDQTQAAARRAAETLFARSKASALGDRFEGTG